MISGTCEFLRANMTSVWCYCLLLLHLDALVLMAEAWYFQGEDKASEISSRMEEDVFGELFDCFDTNVDFLISEEEFLADGDCQSKYNLHRESVRELMGLDSNGDYQLDESELIQGLFEREGLSDLFSKRK